MQISNIIKNQQDRHFTKFIHNWKPLPREERERWQEKEREGWLVQYASHVLSASTTVAGTRAPYGGRSPLVRSASLAMPHYRPPSSQL